MSNTLAIAAVTGVLTARIQTLLDSAAMTGFDVTTNHPTESDDPGVYVHLYQLLPNAELRNQTLPERRSDGSAVSQPRLAVDLYYLLTFAGNNADFDPERLAGLVMTGLQDIPLLSNEEIADYVANLSAGHVLLNSDLGDQLERVRFTPLSLDVEELSRVWGMFGQTFHRLSVAYRASVVMLEPEVNHGRALPVTSRDITVFQLRQPRITGAASSERDLPVVEFGEELVVTGKALRGETTYLRVGGTRLAAPDATDTEIRQPFDLAAGFASGLLPVQVSHDVTLGDGSAREAAASNSTPVALVPTVAMDSATAVAGVDDAGDPVLRIRINAEPVPSAGQGIELLLSGMSGQGRISSEHWELDGNVVIFTIPRIDAGDYLVRLEIDGAVTLLTTDSVTGEFDGPMVTVT